MCKTFAIPKFYKIIFACVLAMVATQTPVFTPIAAQASQCFQAHDEGSLQSAIQATNLAGQGEHCIEITNDISLTQSTLPIDNAQGNIIIDGGGFSVDGQQNAGIRVFEVQGGSQVTFKHLTITGGNTDNGAGIFIHVGALVMLNHSVVSNNHATQDGGGIFIDGLIGPNDSSLVIDRSTIDGNTAQHRGGGIFGDDGPIAATKSTFSNNVSQLGGGAIDNIDGGVLLQQSTVSGNQGQGALRNENGGSLLINSTVTNNIGGGIFNDVSANAILVNTIVADQQSGNDCVTGAGSTTISNGHNLDSDSSCNLSSDLKDIPGGDAKLQPLQDNGGETLTHALHRRSQALEKGNDDFCAIGEATDQRGIPLPQKIRCDIGAYEYQKPYTADLSISKKDIDDPVDQGENIAYTIKVTNYGPHTARHVVVSDRLPGGVIFVSVDHERCTQRNRLVSCNLGTIENGDSHEITITVSTTNHTKHYLSNDAKAKSSIRDITPWNNKVSEATLVCDYKANDEASLNAAIECVNAAGPGVHGIEITDDITLSPSDIQVSQNEIDAFFETVQQIIRILDEHPSQPLNDVSLMEIITSLLIAPDSLVDNETVLEVAQILLTHPSMPLENIDEDLITEIALQSALIPINNPLADGIIVHGNGFTVDGNGNWPLFEIQFQTNVQIQELTMTGGAAPLGASAIRNFGSLAIDRSTVSGNRSLLGSAIGNFGGLNVVNSTVSENRTNQGGSIGNFGILNMFNSTLSHNTATAGAAIRNFANTTSMVNSIIANQIEGNDCQIFDGAIDSHGNNLDSDNTCNLNQASDIPNGNAALGPLRDNGGSTLTHALLVNSDAIDSGNDGFCNAHPVNQVDQRNVARVRGPHCDIGAFEAEADIVANQDMLYLSPLTNGRIGDLRFRDEDILMYDGNNGSWELYFDGSDVGLGGSGVDLNAFALLDDDNILMSFNKNVTLPGIGQVQNRDIVQFVPSLLGKQTEGTFSIYLDGSDVKLNSGGENIDAISIAPDGRLVISTIGNHLVDGIQGLDEDMLIFNATSLGEDTEGTWQQYFDGSDVQLTLSSEDTMGAMIDSVSNRIYLTTLGNFKVPGLEGKGSDIFICQPTSVGTNTACTFEMFWKGADHGFSNEIIDAFAIKTHNTTSGTLQRLTVDEVDEEDGDQNDTDDDDITEVEHGRYQLFLPLLNN